MKGHQFILLLLLVITVSCSFLTKKVESLSATNHNSNKTNYANKKTLHCPANNKIQILLEDESTLKFYLPFVPTLFENKAYSFIQKASMLALIEMSRRPDLASPGARLQYFLRYNHKDYYFDFRPKNLEDEDKMPYLKGIDALLKTFDKTKSLIKIAEILNQNLPPNINVSSEFENFLQVNKNDISKNSILSSIFFKGDEVLTRHESFKRNNLVQIIKDFNIDTSSKDSFYDSSKNSLYKVNSGYPDLFLNCNFDINKDSSLREEFAFTEQKKSLYFALKEDNNFFIAVSSANIKKPLQTIGSTYFFKSLPISQPLPICQFSNPIQDIVLFSTSGRSPSQHLKHLISYDINLVDSFLPLEELLQFSRHLFLSSPDRILYESKRGRKSQLDFFLSMNFPIYHVEAIGDIIGLGTFKKPAPMENSLIVDERSNAKLWCAP